MDSASKQEIDGTIFESLPNTTFKVKLDDGRDVTAHLAGRMRMHYIKILLGDRVKVEMSLYDRGRGRIIYRYRS